MNLRAQASPIIDDDQKPGTPGYGNAPPSFEHHYTNEKTRSRRAAYSFPISHDSNVMNYENDGGSPGGKIFDSYTWPDSQAPSKNITPVPLPNLRKIIKKKVVPVSSRILRSQIKKE